MPTVIQTIMFKKQYWTLKRAKSWLKEHDYTNSGVDETDKYYRFRQIDPSEFDKSSFRTISFKPSVKAVVGSMLKANPNERFIQDAFDEIDNKDTEGAFTRYVKNNFYGQNTPQKRMAVAEHIVDAYQKWVHKGKKGTAPYNLKTYRRAKFYINIQRN